MYQSQKLEMNLELLQFLQKFNSLSNNILFKPLLFRRRLLHDLSQALIQSMESNTFCLEFHFIKKESITNFDVRYGFFSVKR